MKFKLCESIDDIDLKQNIEMIEDILNFDDQDFAVALGMSISDFHENVDNPNKEFLDNLYDFAYNQNIYINTIKWQEYKEVYTDNETKILCHGSRNGIRGNIRVDLSDNSNDFGKGFYCGETLSQAGMFVSDEPDSCIYIIKFNAQGLDYIKFKIDNDWMFAVAYYRDTLGEYSNSSYIKELIDKIEAVDYVIAPIADNKMFQILDLFTSGQITDKQCQYALAATHLGYQYVFKKQNCINNIDIMEELYLCPVEKSIYNKRADIETNTSINKSILARKKFKDVGKYIYEIL